MNFLDLSHSSRIEGLEINFRAIFHANNLLTQSLTQLELEGWNITDEHLKYFEHLKNLTYLNLAETRVKGPGFFHLRSLLKLRKLFLGSCTELVKFRRIAKLKQLNVLDVNRCSKLKKLSSIKSLTHLRCLNLRFTSVTVNSLPSLESLKKLRILFIDSCLLEKISDEMMGSLKTSISNLSFQGIMNPLETEISLIVDEAPEATV